MAVLVADCPRCGASKITFDVLADQCVKPGPPAVHEAFSVCRHCGRSTVFQLVVTGSLPVSRSGGLAGDGGVVNHYVRVGGYVNLSDMWAEQPPDDLPEAIERVFREGATCLAVGCFNASATMFRLCVDLATKDLLPAPNGGTGPNKKQREYLSLRLAWLFDHEHLPERLRRLSNCIKDDGNDGAHQGTLGEKEAKDLLDFTRVLLEHIYTEPARVARAEQRTNSRRNG